MKEFVNEEIFEENEAPVVAIVWWLTYLLGGKVIIPHDEKFWLDNFPAEVRLVLREENGKIVLVSEQPGWVS